MADEEEDRRRFFRVHDRVPLYLEPVDEAGAEAVLAEMEEESENRFGLAAHFAATTNQMDHVLNRIREHHPDVALYLQSINQKLDAVARVLLLEEDRVTRMESLEVDLSASGLGTPWREPMEEGQLLRVELITGAHARVLALGKVIRCTPLERPAHGLTHHLAIDFEEIAEHDEDLIVQEVMRRQAELLRERRSHGPD